MNRVRCNIKRRCNYKIVCINVCSVFLMKSRFNRLLNKV